MSTAGHVFSNDERPPVLRWIVAGCFIVALHLALVFLLLHFKEEPVSGSETPSAIMIELAPLAVAPPVAETMDVPPAPEKTEEAQPEEVKPRAPDVVPPPVEPPPPVVEPPPPEAVAVPEAPLAPKPAAVLPPPPKPQRAAPKAEKKVAKPVKQKPPAERTAAPPRAEAAPGRRSAGPAPSTAGAESSDAWRSAVVSRIFGAKSCPAGGGSGVATVSFSITAGGGLGGARIAGSSGHAALDAQAVSIVRRAAPYPPPPQHGTVSLSIPIRFTCG